MSSLLLRDHFFMDDTRVEFVVYSEKDKKRNAPRVDVKLKDEDLNGAGIV